MAKTAEIPSSYCVFQSIVNKTIHNKEQLPSLPSMTFSIRQALMNPNADHQLLADLIIKDPSLTATILKSASSPLYKTLHFPSTLKEALAILGTQMINNLVMTHCINSMFMIKRPYLEKLFKRAWRRLLLKCGICRYLSQELGYQPVEHPMMAALLSEIGTLLLISSLHDASELPDESTYLNLCRSYSKKLGIVLLKKWNMEQRFFDVIRHLGDWSYSKEPDLTLTDLVNLSLFHAIGFQRKDEATTEINTLAAYRKLPKSAKALDKSGRLTLVSSNQDKIQLIIESFS